MAQVKRDHQVWSSGDEDEDINNIKGNGKICMLETANEDRLTKLEKNYCFIEKDGTLTIFEQVKLMIDSNNYSIHDC